LTGEEEIVNPGATHTSCTIEKVNLKEHYDIAVIDEIQMISDPFRGMAWSKAVLGLKCDEIHICGAANARFILETIINDCKDEYEIKEYTRAIPLEIEYKNFSYNDAVEGDAIVVFSKKRVLEIAEEYSSRGIKTSVIYGDLPPEVRKMQYEQFINKENKILVTTDAIGMGVNLPIRRIIFMSIRKFDGEEVRELTSQEVKQVGGRAGRIGIYDVGYIASVGGNADAIKAKIETEDEVIKQAIIGPSEAILKIRSLPLNEKLALWSTREEKLDYYKKMDTSEYLIILDRIKKYKLSEEVQWDLLKVPFDVSRDELMDAFLDYVDELFINKQEELFKPECFKGSLDDLEIYYQKVNMYYSFSKIFNLKFDAKWVYDERIRISEDINDILLRI
jgi:ATP-dependent RNA helicase SUPV3L1/SUV3